MERDKYVELYDTYKDLFTDKQKEYFEDYYFEDFSLSEIAENKSVSRSIVSKTINKMEQKLEEYENVLGIISKDNKVRAILKEYPQLLDKYNNI